MPRGRIDHRGMEKRTRRAYLSPRLGDGVGRHIAARMQAEPLGGVSAASIRWFPCGIRVRDSGAPHSPRRDGRIGSMDPRRYDRLPTLRPFATRNGKIRNPKTWTPNAGTRSASWCFQRNAHAGVTGLHLLSPFHTDLHDTRAACCFDRRRCPPRPGRSVAGPPGWKSGWCLGARLSQRARGNRAPCRRPFRGRSGRPVDGRCEPDQVASRPHHVVLRAIRAGAARGGSSQLRRTLCLSVQFLLCRGRRAPCPAETRIGDAPRLRRGGALSRPCGRGGGRPPPVVIR